MNTPKRYHIVYFAHKTESEMLEGFYSCSLIMKNNRKLCLLDEYFKLNENYYNFLIIQLYISGTGNPQFSI
jgi:hypothetical protein